MRRTLGRWWAPSLAVALALLACQPSPPPPAPPAVPGTEQAGRPPAAVAQEAEREKEALEAAVEAYVFGYPLMSAELERRVATNVDRPRGARAPMGQLARGAAPAAGTPPRPSLDLLQARSWIDVGNEPWLLGLPESRGRHHVVTIRSAWNQVLDSAGGKGAKRRATRIAVAGPAWSGKAPAGVRLVRSPTALVRIDLRVLAAGGASDRAEAQAWLARLTLLPLGANPKKYSPPPGRPDASLDMERPVRDRLHALDPVVYFKLLATLLKTNPPAPDDAALLPTLARIGLVPGKDYDPTGLDASIIKALVAVPAAAQERIAAAATPAAPVNGWTLAGVGGTTTTGYLGRAAVVAAGIDGRLDGVALTAEVDGEGRPLDGRGRLALRFPRGRGPPAEVLWTLTAYDERGAPAAGPGGRGPLTSKGKLQYGRDGSLELLLQAAPPRGREANWLQVPAGRYTLVLRLHGARERDPSVLDGTWTPPAVVKAR